MSMALVPHHLHAVVHENGYSALRNVPGQGWCGLLPFFVTWAVVVDLTVGCYGRRYCYEHHEDALEALSSWDGRQHPSGPWIKCKGAGIDLLNPELVLA
jgi:hypothetical protein